MPLEGQKLPAGQGIADDKPRVGQKLPAGHGVMAVKLLEGQ
jgi:hypothetical protein